MFNCKSAIGSAIGGVVITLATGLYNATAGGFVGSIGYGFPMIWLRRLVIAPQYNPWRINATGLIVDIVIWFIILELLWLAGRSLAKNGAPQKSRARARRKR